MQIDIMTPWKLIIITDQILVGNSWEMYPSLVYQGSFTLKAMYGDGDPDITEPGKCKVELEVTKLSADAIKTDGKVYAVQEDHAL